MYLRVNLLGPGPRLIKKKLPGRGLTKVEKHCFTARQLCTKVTDLALCCITSLDFVMMIRFGPKCVGI